MSYSIDTRNIPWLTNFEAAQKYFKARDLPAGKLWQEHETARPLDGNRQPHNRIVKINNVLHGEGYAMTLYSTPLITYYQDGTITARLHNSVSSNAFFYRLSPDRISYFSACGRLYLRVQTGKIVRYVWGGGPITISPTGEITGTEPRKKRVLDKKAARQAAECLKPLFQWYDGSVALGLTFSSFTDARSVLRTMCAAHDLLAAIQNPENFERLAQFCHNKSGLRLSLYEALGLYSTEPVDDTIKPTALGR
jgi:hypothetical protein